MLENTLKKRLAAGETVYGCITRYPEGALAELIAVAGFDFVVFDGEHGTLEPRNIEDLTRAAEARGITPIARVTTNQAHIILRYLDTGVHGVHIPWVNTVADVETAVRSAKYGPRGTRGLAGSRASNWGFGESIAEYTAQANRETMVIIHIETTEAVDAAAEYAAVDDVDVLFIGPTDLSHSLGHPGDVSHPEVVAAMERVAEAVVPTEKVLGIYTGTPEMAIRWRERGARYLATGIDGFIAQGLQGFVDRVRS